MNRKEKNIFTSTPHQAIPKLVSRLFEDIPVSPISEGSELKIPNGPQTISVPSKSQPTGAIRKRKVEAKKKENKGKAAPESVTDRVLEELGMEAQGVCNKALSHSRNLYNMFPEPIILDSDEENCVMSKKPEGKNKQDSKVKQPSVLKNQKEKKIKNDVQVISDSDEENCVNPKRPMRKANQVSKVKQTGILKNQKEEKIKEHIPVTLDPGEKNCVMPKRPVRKTNQVSKVIQTGILKNHREEKIKECVPGNSRTSQLTHPAAGRKLKKDSSVQASQLSVISTVVSLRSNNVNSVSKTKGQSNNQPINHEKSPSVDDEEDDLFPAYQVGSIHRSINKNKVRENFRLSLEVDEKFPIEWHGKRSKTEDNKTEKVLSIGNSELCESEDEGSNCKNNECGGKDGQVVNDKNENTALISRFQDVTFKKHIRGGIVARCLKNDQNEIGYLEVLPNEVFDGQRSNITFVVIEGQAKVLYGRTQQTLSEGDMIHIKADSGYQLRSSGRSHVRFMYIVAQDR